MKTFRVVAAICGAFALAVPGVASALATNRDGSASTPNPYKLAALPARSATTPVFPLVRNKIPYFFNDNASNYSAYPNDVAAVARLGGAYGVRQDIYWPSVEWESDDNWNWGSTDSLYAADVANGLRPMWVVEYTPRFLVKADQQGDCTMGTYCPNLEPEDVNEAYELGFQLARRYPLIAAFEWRNEPNMTRTWWWGAADYVESPETYSAALIAFAKGVHAAAVNHAGPRVLGGALANAWDSLPAYADRMLAAGVAPQIDGLSMHLYDEQQSPTYNGWLLNSLSTVLAKYPDAAKLRLVDSEQGAARAATSNNNFVFGDAAYGTSTAASQSQSDRLIAQYSAFANRSASIPLASRFDSFTFFTLLPLWTAPGYSLFNVDSAGTAYTPSWSYCDIRRLLLGDTSLPALPAGYGSCQPKPTGAPTHV